ncbi:35_t:CDS:2 [Funneliformis geosporum]|nr:35_t:CDS:2 [Funneliformis geosporum]
MLDIKLAELSSSGEEASKVYPVAFLIGTPFLWTLTGSPLFRGDTLYSWFDLTTLGIAHISDPSALQWTNLFAAFSNINSLGAQLYYALTKLAEVRSKTHSNVLFSDIVPDRYDGFHSKPQKSGSHGFGIYVIAVAAAESAIGLAIIVAFYRLRGSIAISNPKRGIICSSCYRGHLQNTWDDGLVLAWLLLLFLGPYGAMVGATVANKFPLRQQKEIGFQRQPLGNEDEEAVIGRKLTDKDKKAGLANGRQVEVTLLGRSTRWSVFKLFPVYKGSNLIEKNPKWGDTLWSKATGPPSPVYWGV